MGLIFERINNTGTKLGMMDLMVAWTWSEDFHLKTAIEGITESLEEKGSTGISMRVMLQAISAVIQDTTKSKAILELNPSTVREQFDRVQMALERTVDFLSTEFNCVSSDFLPHVQQIVPLVRFFDATSSPTAAQYDALRRWFWATSFSRRYAGQTDDKMDGDIACMLALSNGDMASVDRYCHTLDVRILVATNFSKGAPFCACFPFADVGTGTSGPRKGYQVATKQSGVALSAFNKKEYHHVFPRAFLARRELSTDNRINSLLNFCFLPADSNKQMNKRDVSDYFFNLVPQERYQEVLKSNILPLNKEIYRTDDYNKFLEERAALVMQKVDELVTG